MDDDFMDMMNESIEIDDTYRCLLEQDIFSDIERGMSRYDLEQKYCGRYLFDRYMIDACDWNGTLRNREMLEED